MAPRADPADLAGNPPLDPPVVASARPASPALPDAVPARPRGEVTPAPWLDGAERVAAVRRPDGVYVVAAGVGWLRVFAVDPMIRPGQPGRRGEAQLIASIDGSGDRSIDGSGDRSIDGSGEGAGGAHVLEILDTDGDGVDEIVVGRGIGRGALDAPASVVIYEFDGHALTRADAIPLPPTHQARIASVALAPDGDLWLIAFDSKFMARVLVAERVAGRVAASDRPADGARWQVRTHDRMRVPLDLAIGDLDGDGAAEVVVARPYGEDKDAPGEVFVLGSDRARTLLPTTRGARAVLIHDGQLFYADGWHRRYGQQAQALITRARWRSGPARYEAEVVARVADRFGYDRLRVGDIDGDRQADLVAAGNGPAVTLPRLAGRAGPVTALGTVEARDAFPADLDGDGRDEVILAGPAPHIWRLR